MLPPITTARWVVIAGLPPCAGRRPSRRPRGDESRRPCAGLVDLHRLRSPAEVRRPGTCELDRVARLAPRHLGHQDGAPTTLVNSSMRAAPHLGRVADR